MFLEMYEFAATVLNGATLKFELTENRTMKIFAENERDELEESLVVEVTREFLSQIEKNNCDHFIKREITQNYNKILTEVANSK